MTGRLCTHLVSVLVLQGAHQMANCKNKTRQSAKEKGNLCSCYLQRCPHFPIVPDPTNDVASPVYCTYPPSYHSHAHTRSTSWAIFIQVLSQAQHLVSRSCLSCFCTHSSICSSIPSVHTPPSVQVSLLVKPSLPIATPRLREVCLPHTQPGSLPPCPTANSIHIIAQSAVSTVSPI